MSKALQMMKGLGQERNYLQLALGLIFISYGGYRLYTFFHGEEHPVYRIIVVSGIILFGAWDIYRFFKTSRKK